MSIAKYKTKDPDLLNVEAALKRSAQRALEEGKKTNTPVYVWENGEIVDLITNNKVDPNDYLKPFRNKLIK